METQQRNRLAYDQIVESYAERNTIMQPYVLDSAAFIIQKLQQQDLPARYLYLGCGVGRDLVWFADHGMHLMGADLSSGMLHESQTTCHNGKSVVYWRQVAGCMWLCKKGKRKALKRVRMSL